MCSFFSAKRKKKDSIVKRTTSVILQDVEVEGKSPKVSNFTFVIPGLSLIVQEKNAS